MAETSVTIPGIVYVIDCLFVRVRSFDPLTSVENLCVVPVSKASAEQRRGRAGRMRPGKCYRLCTESDYQKLKEESTSEIQRSNLSSFIIQLKALGIDNIANFEFFSPPPVESVCHSLELLHALGAVDESCMLTEKGHIMVEFPLDPRFSKMLIASGEMGCSEEILSIAAMLSVQNVYLNGRTSISAQKAEWAKLRFAVREGDHITLLNIFNSFQRQQKRPGWCYDLFLNYKSLKMAVNIRKKLRKLMEEFGIPIVTCGGDEETILKCIVVGFFSNAAKLQNDGSYKTVKGNEDLRIHPNSVLHEAGPGWVVYHDVVITKEKYMTNVSVLEPKWLIDLAFFHI